MAFPSIKFKATNTELQPNHQALLEQKFLSLEKFIGEAGDVKCEVEFEQITAHQSGDIHRVEANLYRDGTLFRAEATEDSFEKAIDEVRDELDKELRRANDKNDTLLKRGGRAIKAMLRGE